jgi:protein-L-isoaspartate(D-aspartate) O-methyltransferase
MTLARLAAIAACLTTLTMAEARREPSLMASGALSAAAALGTPSAQAPTTASAEARFGAMRRAMVDQQLKARGIRSEAVLAAMAKVPRHRFVRPTDADRAYSDMPLPIGSGQTISQPFIVAYMTEALDVARDEKVLEIGTGSGYQAAVLAELAREVYTIEIIPELAERARALLQELGYRNVHVRVGDGYLGWPEAQPFDGIMVTAAPDQVPEPLVQQLAPNGHMAIPVGRGVQKLLVISKTSRGVVRQETLDVLFVPLVRKPR